MPIRRWVVLAHERARVVDVRNLGVDGVVRLAELDVDALMDLTTVGADIVPDVDRVRVEIARDHMAFERRRASRLAEEARESVPPVHGWPKAERMDLLVNIARKAAADRGRDRSADETLRAAIRHDLLVRPVPYEVPALLHALRQEPAHQHIVGLIEEVTQVFPFADRCLVALTLPVGLRIRKFLNGDYVRDTANGQHLRQLELALRRQYRLRRVVFDPKLYAPDSLRGIAPQRMRQYLCDLESSGERAQPPARPVRVAARRDGQWTMVHVLGVAVLDAADATLARAWSRLPLHQADAWLPIGTFDGFDAKTVVPGVMFEASSPGVCTLSEGLREGDAAIRRLRTGIQGPAPESIFMAPLRMALPVASGPAFR